jgi:hypothetical protein
MLSAPATVRTLPPSATIHETQQRTTCRCFCTAIRVPRWGDIPVSEPESPNANAVYPRPLRFCSCRGPRRYWRFPYGVDSMECLARPTLRSGGDRLTPRKRHCSMPYRMRSIYNILMRSPIVARRGAVAEGPHKGGRATPSRACCLTRSSIPRWKATCCVRGGYAEPSRLQIAARKLVITVRALIGPIPDLAWLASGQTHPWPAEQRPTMIANSDGKSRIVRPQCGASARAL